MELMHARARRRFARGLKRKPMALVKKLRRAKKEAPPNEKPEIVKTHLRNMIIVPEMVGSIVGIYNGKTFNQVSNEESVLFNKVILCVIILIFISLFCFLSVDIRWRYTTHYKATSILLWIYVLAIMHIVDPIDYSMFISICHYLIMSCFCKWVWYFSIPVQGNIFYK